MRDTLAIVAIFAVLFVLEWRYRRGILRVAAALMALAILWLYQPSFTWARRRALDTPPAERVVMNPVGSSTRDSLSPYQSGVYTTMKWVDYYADVNAESRLAAIGALFWLACSPALRRARGSV